MNKLQQAIAGTAAELARFAAGPRFWTTLVDVFGAGQGKASAHAIHTLLLGRNLAGLARVELVSASVLGTAQAAYARSTSTIYVSDQFAAEATLPQLQAALLEEIGHAIDARINANDRAGDEGELFSLLVRGIQPSAVERRRIGAENDQRQVTIKGKTLLVEQNTVAPYETTTLFRRTYSKAAGGTETGSYNYLLADYNYAISGTNAAITKTNGPLQTLQLFNGSTTALLTTSLYNPFGEVRISGGDVVFAKSDGNDMEIYHYIAGTPIAPLAGPLRLTNNALLDNNPQIDGSTIIWESWNATTGTNEIFRRDGNAAAVQITQNTTKELDVQLRGKSVAWAALNGSNYDIYFNNASGLIATRVASTTTAGSDDYSPVLGDNNHIAWLNWDQWNAQQQENLYISNNFSSLPAANRGVFKIQTTGSVQKYMFAGMNLAFVQLESNGLFSLKIHNSLTKLITSLSTDMNPESLQTSGNLVTWIEQPGTGGQPSPMPPTANLKLYDGTTTKTIVSAPRISSYLLRGSKILYTKNSPDSQSMYAEDLFLYDSAGPTPTNMQITMGGNIFLTDAGINGSDILWADGGALQLSKPSTKPVLTFTSSAITVVEGFNDPPNATLEVKLSASSPQPVTVSYETFIKTYGPTTAYPGEDYTSTTGQLTFAAGALTQSINIPILNNDWLEADDVFNVRLFDPVNAVLLPGQTTADVTITDTWQVTGPSTSAPFVMPSGVENLTLTGTTNISGVGNSGNNKIQGNPGNNRLDGGPGGYDTLAGGAGNDTYVMRLWQFSTSIEESQTGGIDTVELDISPSPPGSSSFTNGYSLPGFIENVQLIGTRTTRVFVYGNILNNVFIGSSGDDSFSGNGGSDTVNYSGIPQTAAGGLMVNLTTGVASGPGIGNDDFSGIDNVIASRSNDTITGNTNANTIRGHVGKDTINGLGGGDRFDYRVLTDSLLGNNLNSFDSITNFNPNTGGDQFLVSKARAGFLNAPSVTSLTLAAIGASLSATTFLPNYAASFQLVSGTTVRNFVAINDATAGFSALTDGLIEVTLTGGSIGAGNFVVA